LRDEIFAFNWISDYPFVIDPAVFAIVYAVAGNAAIVVALFAPADSVATKGGIAFPALLVWLNA